MKLTSFLQKTTVVFVLCVMAMMAVQAQSYLVPATGSNTITACGGMVYDCGGPNGDYSNSCSGTLIINPATPGCRVTLSGSYNTESNYDKITIYNGAGTTGTVLYNEISGTGTIYAASTTGPLTIRFTSDGSVVRSGFAFQLNCAGSCNCGGPTNVTVAHGNHTITVNWDSATGVSAYFIEYGPHGFTPGTGTRQRITTTSYTINGLTNDREYDIYVWYDCDNDNQITTEIPTMVSDTPGVDFNVPAAGNTGITTCEGHLYDCGGPNGQYQNSMSGYTVIYPDNDGCVVHIEGVYNTESCCDHIYIYDGVGVNGTLLEQVQGSGTVDVTSTVGPLTVQFTSDGSVLYDGFDFTISCRGGCDCGGSPYGIIVATVPLGYEVSWVQSLDSSVQHYIVEYGMSGFTPGTGTTVIVDTNMALLTGLTVFATYDIYVYYDCGDDGVIIDEQPGMVSFCVPEAMNCADLSDLTAPNIHCTTGTYANPYLTAGVVDNGEGQATSRHTVHRTQATDPRTGGRLNVIPPCELYSVRLGNWNTGAEAESLSYDFLVDTAEADILLLKYAAVLEDPQHTAVEQPKFTFELLNQNNQRIDPDCGAADFIANANLGWNAGQSGVLWKDWTNVGVVLTDYHGQTIRIRFTTYDCDQSGHYGYAYFTLGCKKKVIEAESCGEQLENTFTAPAGFNYRWYYSSNPNQTLSTDQTISIFVDGGHDTLCCHVSFVGNEACGFDLTTSLTARYPLALFETERVGCTDSYNMINTSTISFDMETPNGSGDPCQTAHWDFGDGTTSDEYAPTHEFPGPGVYNVQLIAGLADDACLDTISHVLEILDNSPIISGEFEICKGEGTTLHASGGLTYEWLANGEVFARTDDVYVTPEITTIYTLRSKDPDSCEVSSQQTVIVHNPTESTVIDSICLGDSYRDYGFNLAPQMVAGTFRPTRVLPNQYGCDSTVTLQLTVKPLPQIGLGADFKHCFEDDGDAILHVREDDCSSYTWSNGATTQNISVSEGGEYAVTAVKNGCENNGAVTIFDVCPFNLYLPNTITPTNNDGINDVFKLPTVEDIVEFSIVISDRWGRVVFQSTDPNFSWNGNVNGEIRSNAIYTYSILIKTVAAEKIVFNGVLTVL